LKRNQLLSFFIVLISFLCKSNCFAQYDSKAELVRLEKLSDSIRFVTDVPSNCSDSVLSHYSLGCGDRLFWELVKGRKTIVPFLIEKLDDSTKTVVPVPDFGGFYTVADVAYAAMQEIIGNIPTTQFIAWKTDSSCMGKCEYWKYLRDDYKNRKAFQKEVKQWEKTLGGRWIESDSLLTSNGTFPHPNNGYYIREYTLYPYTGYGFHLEYFYLQAHSVGLGYNFMSESINPFIGKRRINFTIDGTLTGLFYNGISALGQRIDFGLNVQDVSPDLHVFIEHNDKNDFRVGGKIGVSFSNLLYFHYRYSYPIGNYENPFISRHGIGITFKLNQVGIVNLFEI